MNKVINSKLIIFVVVAILLIIPVTATSLDDAKEIVNKYYLYSMEKNVDSYSELFDKEYLVNLYGKDYKQLFTEIFTYSEVNDYELEYQYYTESEESLSLFFNLKSDVIVDGEKIKIDNDLVALFSKKDDGLKLKYIILQETFIEQMNQEVIYKAAIISYTEEGSNLEKEANKKNIELVNYDNMIEKGINDYNQKNNFKIFLIILVISILAVFVAVKFKEKIRNKTIKKNINRIEDALNKSKIYVKDNYKKTKHKIQKNSKK